MGKAARTTARLDFDDQCKGDLELRYFSTLTTLGTPHDITLQELRVEAFFPADAKTEEASRRMVGGRSGTSQ